MRETGQYVGTAFTARDMVLIAEKLNEDGLLRYYGWSYCTVLGAYTAAVFPSRFERMVLDGNVNPDDYRASHYRDFVRDAGFPLERADGPARHPVDAVVCLQSGGRRDSPIADTDALVDHFCNDGVSVTYVRDAAGGHFTQAATSFPDVINFLRDRFEGVPISGCSRRNEFLDLLNAGALPKFEIIVVSELLKALGTPVGPTHF
jgi:pimeloyl-ACP methyl ester carboxylesterase